MLGKLGVSPKELRVALAAEINIVVLPFDGVSGYKCTTPNLIYSMFYVLRAMGEII